MFDRVAEQMASLVAFIDMDHNHERGRNAGNVVKMVTQKEDVGVWKGRGRRGKKFPNCKVW